MNFNEAGDSIQDADFPLDDPQTIDTALKNIYTLFGQNTTVVPIQTGQGASESTYRATTFAESIKPAHQAELRKSDLGVQCGKESANLYAIQFNRKADYEAFLGTNPALRKSLAVECEGMVAMLIRLPDPMPPSFRTESGAWLSEGAVVPVYNRDNAEAIKVISRHPPVELRFPEIFWRADLLMGFMRFAAEVNCGTPFLKDKQGNLSLNPMFWAEWFRTTSAICYQPNAHQFVFWEKDGFKLVSEMGVGKALLEFIIKWRGNLPAASVTEKSIKKCVEALKIIAADPNEPGTGAEDVERFLRDKVEPCDEGDVTSEELCECYRDWSKTSKVIPLAGRQFFTTLAGCIAKIFGVGKNHCTERDGKEHRGYSGLRIKQAEGGQV